MNKVILCGRLTRDPEIRTSGENVIAKFSLAVDRRAKKGEEKQADFINCTAFGSDASFVEKFFHKGDGMTLEGRIQTGSFKNKEGKTVYTTDVISERIEFPVGGKNASNNNDSVKAAQEGFRDMPTSEDDVLPFN